LSLTYQNARKHKAGDKRRRKSVREAEENYRKARIEKQKHPETKSF
jgi:hypothetical protein